MATTYSTVYGSFMSKISDYSFTNLTQVELEDQLEDFLKSSLIKFKNCKKDLSDRDESLSQFNNDLSDEEVEILASLMVIEFLKPKIVSSEVYKQVMTDKEFRFYSQANHLEQLIKLSKEMKKEASDLMNSYSYWGRDLRDLND